MVRSVLNRLMSIRWAAVVIVAVLVAVGVVLRWRLLSSDRGDLLADEAFTGLLSAEILNGYLPVMIAGIGYTAPVESYLYAPVAAVFGMSVPLLKLVPVVLWPSGDPSCGDEQHMGTLVWSLG